MTRITNIPRINYRQVILLGIMVLAVYVIGPQLGDLRSSWDYIRHPEQPWLVVPATLFTLATYPFAALIYKSLAFYPLAFTQTIVVQMAAMFLNRLVPAGLGALGANYLYLRHNKHSVAQAGSVVGVNNVIGFVGHGLLVAIGLVFYAGHTSIYWHDIFEQPAKHIGWTIGVIIFFASAVTFAVLQTRLRKFLLSVKRQLATYRQRKKQLLKALLFSMLLTLCNLACFTLCLAALNIELPLLVILIIFTFGVGLAAATPTPGGLGGFEAGLAAGLVANGIPLATAVASALLYRLLSFWLPLVFGIAAMIICQRKGLFEPRRK